MRDGGALAQVRGAGGLAALVADPAVSDVLVNGPREVWVDRGRGLERVECDVGDVRALAVRLAAAGGARLDDAAPVADARLPDGTRLHAVLPPLAAHGALLSLRTMRRRAFALGELVRAGSVHPALARVLGALVAGRANVVVTGGTGTGKTTLLACLLSLVPATERIVCIEEAVELAPDHPHVVHLVPRRPNVEGVGAIGPAELVRHALRMRPDRIVLGEARGAEVREVLTALNTGHEGGWATVHANAVADLPARLEALGALAGMDRDAVAAQATSALHAAVHLRREGSRRWVAELGAVRRWPGGGWGVDPVLAVDATGVLVRGPGWAAFERRWLSGDGGGPGAEAPGCVVPGGARSGTGGAVG